VLAVDGALLSIPFIAAGLLGVISSTPLRLLLTTALLSFVIMVGLDILVIEGLGTRFKLHECLVYLKEWRIGLSMLTPSTIGIVMLVVGALWIWIPVNRVILMMLTTMAMSLLIVRPLDSKSDAFLREYSVQSLFNQARMLRATLNETYTPLEADVAAQRIIGINQLALPPQQPNVIVLVVESLSAVDTLYFGGLHSKFPGLEERARSEGHSFTNFFSNYKNTLGALNSLLNGAPPIPFPLQNGEPISNYPIVAPLPQLFSNAGYHTEIMTTSSLSFEGQGDFYKKIGFTAIKGLDEVPAFVESKKFLFGWPPDEMLFQEANARLATLRETSQPFFLTLLTVTSHPPYIDPRGGENTEDNILEYVDQQISRFYDQLKEDHFFDDGILLILGDHRKWTIPTPAEIEKLGPLAKFRVPLVIFGSEVKKGIIDTRLLSTSHLLLNMSKAVSTDLPLAPYALIVDRESGYYSNSVGAGRLTVITQDESNINSFPLEFEGRSIKWLDGVPVTKNSIEQEIHLQRAAMQSLVTSQEASCSFSDTPKIDKPLTYGLALSQYSGVEIQDSPSDSRLLSPRARIVESIDFPNLGDLPELKDKNEFSLVFRGFLQIPESGLYWFRVESDDGSCFALDKKLVIDANYRRPFLPSDNTQWYNEGTYPLELRYFQQYGNAGVRLCWKTPDSSEWEVVPARYFFTQVQD
jgi:hypothetical protein